MRISDVTTIKLHYDMPVAMADAIHYMPARPTLLVQVHTDEGFIGLGEAATYGGFLESTEAIVLNELRQTILGQDPFKVEKLWQMMATRAHQRGRRGMLMMAMSGIDIALWDIIGQATRTPLYRLLGGYRDTLDAYASAGFYTRDKDIAGLADEFAGYIERGFRYVKMKVGRNPDVMLNPLHDMQAAEYATATLEEDIERVKVVREAIGPKIRLALDANNAWTPSIALQFMRQVERFNIHWFEEPVATDDIEGSAMLAHQLDTPVAGYETETGLPGFRELITRRAVDIVQPDVIWTGGITECRKIAALAQAYGLPVVPHVFSSAVSSIANMHFIAAIPNGGLLEFDQNVNPLRSELLETPIEITPEGKVHLPEGPGLGVKLNQETIKRYQV
ncbi:MAG: mandelate racemase/muconate lactonizing enzyme family protein [Anaerolineae bacterium]|nr:mandelate racemase/muconate lactonizing enzyme family protein [Anaerolineae bacterium]